MIEIKEICKKENIRLWKSHAEKQSYLENKTYALTLAIK